MFLNYLNSRLLDEKVTKFNSIFTKYNVLKINNIENLATLDKFKHSIGFISYFYCYVDFNVKLILF